MYKPMTARNVDIKDLRLPTMVSKKLEGVRGEFTPKGLKTRPMKEFNNKWMAVQFTEVKLLAMSRGIHISGEFYKHGLTFSEISSICRRGEHPRTGEMEFHVFDCWDPAIPNEQFVDRYHRLCNLVLELDLPHVKIAPQAMMHSHGEIDDYYASCIANGYEGLCFKSPVGTYKHGRSTRNEQKFLRIKPEDTYDGIVIDIVERMENLVESEYNELGFLSKRSDKDMKAPTGMAAVAVTRCNDFIKDVNVTLSLGLTDDDRRDIWENRDDYVGKHIKFVGLPVPGMDLPRSPRFKDWRTDLD